MTGAEHLTTEIEAAKRPLRTININQLTIRELDELLIGIRRCVSAMTSHVSPVCGWYG